MLMRSLWLSANPAWLHPPCTLCLRRAISLGEKRRDGEQTLLPTCVDGVPSMRFVLASPSSGGDELDTFAIRIRPRPWSGRTRLSSSSSSRSPSRVAKDRPQTSLHPPPGQLPTPTHTCRAPRSFHHSPSSRLDQRVSCARQWALRTHERPCVLMPSWAASWAATGIHPRVQGRSRL